MSEELQKPPTVKVQLKLKEKQHLDIGKWKMTFNGAVQEVTQQNVQFYSFTIPDAINSYEEDELEEIIIHKINID